MRSGSERKRLTVTLRFEAASAHEGGDHLVAETEAGVLIAKVPLAHKGRHPRAEQVFIAELVDSLHHAEETE